MKILWLCNIPIPRIANHISEKINPSGGWMVGLLDSLVSNDDIELAIAFPLLSSKSIMFGEFEGIKYFGFPKTKDDTQYDKKAETFLYEIISEVQPNNIHIWGTEYPHTLAMVNVCESMGIIDKVLISIQGLCSICAKHYLSGLPRRVVTAYTFRDVIRRENIIKQQKNYEIRGRFEIEALKKAKHITGRTTWDKACTSQINQNSQYHFCNETLRDEFYKHRWEISNCEKHSIFMSQGTSPIKGVHFMLMAMPLILKQFPNAKLYIGGQNIIKSDTLKDKLKTSSYGKYIKELIKKNNLKTHVEFTGVLDEKRICERYMQSHLFVCPSSIENSPNSLGEAMILGVPCVASDVGGVADMLKHNEEGFVYQADAPYMLAYYVCEVFSKNELAIVFSEKAREHALKTHKREENSQRMIDVYKKIGYTYE